MTAVRFRAHLRYTVGSGYAQWVSDQMQVRMGMAFHLREGEPAAELSHVTTDIEPGLREDVTIDAFWPPDRTDLAVDTRDTLLATVPWLRTNEPGDGDRSWMDWHHCQHDQDPPQPCPQPEWRWPE